MPNDLRVVATHLVRRALVGVGVVIFVLHRPRLDGVGGRPVVVFPPEHVLAVRSHRVDHPAVHRACQRPAAGESRHGLVPFVESLVVFHPHQVMSFQELAGHGASSRWCRRCRCRGCIYGLGAWWRKSGGGRCMSSARGCGGGATDICSTVWRLSGGGRWGMSVVAFGGDGKDEERDEDDKGDKKPSGRHWLVVVVVGGGGGGGGV